MKGQILKDWYNLRKNLLLMLGVLVVMMAIFLLSAKELSMTDPAIMTAYASMWSVFFGMQITASFAYDEMSKWEGYAMTMPIARKDYVRAKFAFLLLLIFGGVAAGVGLSLAVTALMMGGLTVAMLQSALISALASVLLSLCSGGICIPLLLRFGSEKGRVLAILVFVVPMGAGMQLVDKLSVLTLSGAMGWIAWLSPVAILLWTWGMYLVACRVFEGKDLA